MLTRMSSPEPRSTLTAKASLSAVSSAIRCLELLSLAEDNGAAVAPGREDEVNGGADVYRLARGRLTADDFVDWCFVRFGLLLRRRFEVVLAERRDCLIATQAHYV